MFPQLPNGMAINIQIYQDRKVKLEEHIRQLMVNFKKLRVIYDKVYENTATLHTQPVEVSPTAQTVYTNLI